MFVHPLYKNLTLPEKDASTQYVVKSIVISFVLGHKLEDTARYAGLLLAPAEGFSLWQRAFFALRAKKQFFFVFWQIQAILVFSSNLSNFKKKTKSPKKSNKKLKKLKKIRKNQKNQKKKNPAYWRQSISRPMQIVAPIPQQGGPRIPQNPNF